MALEEYHLEETLCYLEVFFNFGTHHKLHHWLTKAESLVATIGKDISQQKVFFISVCSGVTCGDLFVGKDEQGSDMAVMPKEFMEYLFSGGLQPLIHGDTVFKLSCGPLITFLQSISSLKEGLLELRPAYTIAFGAKCFISAVIKSFIIAFSIQVIIQGHDLRKVFKDLLDVSIKLSMHTDAYIFQVKEKATSTSRDPNNPLHLYPLMVTIKGLVKTNLALLGTSVHASPQPSPYEIIKTIAKDNEAKGWIKQMGI
ncbi:hypothetical protein EDD15DRAFT_2200073 [Pisolithus albus]|nr:hypothetical protein EDD15DRAFT_2200073 [Pisolithus albus]